MSDDDAAISGLHEEIDILQSEINYLNKLIQSNEDDAKKYDAFEMRLKNVERELKNLDFMIKSMDSDLRDVIASLTQNIKYREY